MSHHEIVNGLSEKKTGSIRKELFSSVDKINFKCILLYRRHA